MHSTGPTDRFDLVWIQVAPCSGKNEVGRPVNFSWRNSQIPGTGSNDILSDPSPTCATAVLIRFVSGLLRSESENLRRILTWPRTLSTASATRTPKAAYTDILTIIRINALVKQQKFIEAQHLAGSISSEDTERGCYLPCNSLRRKPDRVLGFELISTR